eukprot:SAG31_NODE_1512_length_8055_cov_3.286199_2_plen_203_part_00
MIWSCSQRHGLRLENHFLRDGGEISAQLLGSLRVAMLSGEELRELAHCEDHRQSSGVLLSTDPTSGPISESSERKTCAALRSILNGLSQAFASVCVFLYCFPVSSSGSIILFSCVQRWTQENSIITLKWLVAGFCFSMCCLHKPQCSLLWDLTAHVLRQMLMRGKLNHQRNNPHHALHFPTACYCTQNGKSNALNGLSHLVQ